MIALFKRSHLTFTRFSALLMLVVTINVVVNSVVPTMSTLVVLQKQIVSMTSLDAIDYDFSTGSGACKPPKHSYIDYTTFFSPKSFLPSYSPDVSKLLAYEPFLAKSQVYFEIFVPPDNQA